MKNIIFILLLIAVAYCAYPNVNDVVCGLKKKTYGVQIWLMTLEKFPKYEKIANEIIADCPKIKRDMTCILYHQYQFINSNSQDYREEIKVKSNKILDDLNCWVLFK